MMSEFDLRRKRCVERAVYQDQDAWIELLSQRDVSETKICSRQRQRDVRDKEIKLDQDRDA